MCAFIVSEIPDHEYTSSVCTNELALIWMYDHIVDWMIVGIVSLDEARSCIPDSYCAVL